MVYTMPKTVFLKKQNKTKKAILATSKLKIRNIELFLM